jgi:predicted DNA-binding transcriptional regulator AlpA
MQQDLFYARADLARKSTLPRRPGERIFAVRTVMDSLPDLGLLSPEQVSQVTGIAVATLDTWRCRRIGPQFIKLGRKIWYRLLDLEAWIKQNRQETHNELTKSRRNMALPILRGGAGVERKHRLGRHRTQQERGANGGSRSPEAGERGPCGAVQTAG